MKKNFIRSLSILTLVAANLVAVQPAVFAATTANASVQTESTTNTTIEAPYSFGMTMGSGLTKVFGWSVVQNAVNYMLYADKTSLVDGTTTTIKLKETSDNEAAVDFELGYIYSRVYIVAVDAAGNVSSPKFYYTPFDYSAGTVSVPYTFRLTNGSGFVKEFGWSVVQGAAYYNIFAERTCKADGTVNVVKLATTTDNSKAVEFELGYNYKAFIVAVDANGNYSNPKYLEHIIEY